MPNINTQIDTLASHIQAVRDSRSAAVAVDEKGELIRLGFKGKVAQALINLGVARKGKWSGRAVVALVGKENFELLCKPSEQRLQNSIRNVAELIHELETHGLDDDLSTAVKSKVDKAIPLGSTDLTGDSFKELHQVIQKEILPSRRAYRAEVAAQLEAGRGAPTIENATDRGVAIAIAALEENMEEHAMPYQSVTLMSMRTTLGLGAITYSHPVGPTSPVDKKFAREVCGKNLDSKLLSRDIWDANKILGELRAAELHIREETVGMEEDPEVSMDEYVKTKLAPLKEKLLASLKASLPEKEAIRKAPGGETEVVAEAKNPQEGIESSSLKSALKPHKALGEASVDPASAAPKRRIQFGRAEAQAIEKNYTHGSFKVNDSNRTEWVRAMENWLADSENPQTAYAVADVLAHRGDIGQDDHETMKAVSLLRMNPVFLKPENFDAMKVNINAAERENRRIEGGFPDDIKQNYRQNIEAYKAAAQRQLDIAGLLSDKLREYEQQLYELDNPREPAGAAEVVSDEELASAAEPVSDELASAAEPVQPREPASTPVKYEERLKALSEEFGKSDEALEAYKVFVTPSSDNAETIGTGEGAMLDVKAMKGAARSLRAHAQSVLTSLNHGRLFVSEK